METMCRENGNSDSILGGQIRSDMQDLRLALLFVESFVTEIRVV